MLKVKLLSPAAKAPTIAHPGEDLGYDVYCAEGATIAPGGQALLPTGISIEITDEDLALKGRYGALLRDRSSMASRRLAITAGVIDAGYRGEVKVIMENLGDQPAHIAAGDKIANLIPYPVFTAGVAVVEELQGSKREGGGFGSSGR